MEWQIARDCDPCGHIQGNWAVYRYETCMNSHIYTMIITCYVISSCFGQRGVKLEGMQWCSDGEASEKCVPGGLRAEEILTRGHISCDLLASVGSHEARSALREHERTTFRSAGHRFGA